MLAATNLTILQQELEAQVKDKEELQTLRNKNREGNTSAFYQMYTTCDLQFIVWEYYGNKRLCRVTSL